MPELIHLWRDMYTFDAEGYVAVAMPMRVSPGVQTMGGEARSKVPIHTKYY